MKQTCLCPRTLQDVLNDVHNPACGLEISAAYELGERVLKKTAVLLAAVLSVLGMGQAAFAEQVLVHIHAFKSAGVVNISSEVKDPSPRGFIYDQPDGSVKFVLEKPGSMYAWTGVGFPSNQPSVPKMRLYPGDTLRISYRGSTSEQGTRLVAEANVQNVGESHNLICDGKKRTLDIVVPSDGADYRLDRLYLKLTNYGNAAQCVLYDFRVYRNNIDNRLDADKILKNPPAVRAELKKHNGVMAPFINGKPVSLFGWSPMIPTNIDDGAFKTMFGDLALPCVLLPFNPGYESDTGYFAPTWLGPDHFDWSGLDAQIERAVRYNPHVYVILLLAFDGSSWWLASHTGARGDNPATVDFLSHEWEKASRDVIRQMIAHIQTSKYAQNVIGYELFNGGTLDGGFRAELYTSLARKRFSAFLEKRYKTVATLRKAWGDPNATFASACPQTRSDDMFKNPYSLFFQVGKYRRVADTEDFVFWESSQVNIDFAKTVKDATHDSSLAGSVGMGEFLVGAWDSKGIGGTRIKYLAQCPYFDYWDRWEPYTGRGLGYWGSGAPLVPVQGLTEMGKSWFLQDDVRPHTGPDFGYGATANIGETTAKQRRVLLNSIIQGTQPYLWQQGYSYNTEDQKPLWTEQRKILQRAKNADCSSVAEVAYVFDMDYARYCGYDFAKSSPTRGFEIIDYPRFLYARAGVPYDMVFLDQIEKLKKYKSLCVLSVLGP